MTPTTESTTSCKKRKCVHLWIKEKSESLTLAAQLQVSKAKLARLQANPDLLGTINSEDLDVLLKEHSNIRDAIRERWKCCRQQHTYYIEVGRSICEKYARVLG
jgi:hypothetical protein